MPLTNPTNNILEAMRLVESDRRSEIRLNANGGNSILLVCDPMQETKYIDHLRKLLPETGYSIIDLNQLLIDFVTHHQSDLVDLFDQLQSAPNQIFKAPAGEESEDLFKDIMMHIMESYKMEKVPVLINTGSLYGSGIDNIHLMENEFVMNASLPLIILYPATHDGERLLFLGKRPASKYRCMIVQ